MLILFNCVIRYFGNLEKFFDFVRKEFRRNVSFSLVGFNSVCSGV